MIIGLSYSEFMTAAKKLERVSVEDYLAGELVSRIRHEYLAGVVYAMSGARLVHNEIAGNTFAAFHARLRGRKCKPYNPDTKVRIKLPNQVRFYYPDASVACGDTNPVESFYDEPAVIVEVLSRSTRRIDEGEKKDAYLTIPSLRAYLMIEQDMPRVVVYRRADQGYVEEVYEGLEAVIPLSEIEIDLPLTDVYEAVAFEPEPESEDELR